MSRLSLSGAGLALALAWANPVLAAEFDPELVARAEAEGSVVWYTGLLADEAAAPMVSAFNETYPKVHASFVRNTGSKISEMLEAEAAAGAMIGDVFDSSTTVASIAPLGLIEPYVPAAAADIPEIYRDKDGLWTAQVVYFLAVGYNSDLVSAEDAPEDYADLLDPKWKGKIGWSSSGTASGVGFVGNVLDQLGEAEGMAFLQKLAAQDIQFIKGGGAQTLQAVADGEIEIGLSIFTHHTLIQARNGGHVGWVKFEPLLSFPNPIGLVKNAPHPNAGKLLIEFVLLERGQEVLRDSDHIPASTLVDPVDASVKTGFAVNFLTPARTAETRDAWSKVVDDLFRK